MNLINKILKPFGRYILFMDWEKAKSVQNSLASGKRCWKRNSKSFEIVEQIEQDLGDFTDTSALFFTVVNTITEEVGK